MLCSDLNRKRKPCGNQATSPYGLCYAHERNRFRFPRTQQEHLYSTMFLTYLPGVIHTLNNTKTFGGALSASMPGDQRNKPHFVKLTP